MKPLMMIIDPNRDGGGGDVFLPVRGMGGPSRHELFRQLCVARDWIGFWVCVSVVGWLTAVLVFLLR